MPALLKSKMVDRVSGLSVQKLPLYIPTDTIDDLLESSTVSSISKIKLVTTAIWDIGDPNNNMLLSLLRETNTAPHPTQAQTLRSIRASCHADLADLDAEIRRLHNAIIDLSGKLKDVSAQRVQRQNLVNACSYYMSPLRQLAQETLGEIFLYCLPSHGRPLTMDAPLSLAHVCSAWRKAALGMPLLWTNLSLKTNMRPRRSDNAGKLDNMMQFWFDCARNSPLTFHFYNRFNHQYENEDPPVIETMIEHAGRLRRLHLSSESIYDVREFVQLPSGNVNMLESLQLEVANLYDCEIPFTAFRTAPLLCEVVLNVVNPYFCLALPWKQLTKLSVIGVGMIQIQMLLMLRDCSQLISGTFTLTPSHQEGNTITHEFGDKPLVLQNLLDLEVILPFSDDDEPETSVEVFKSLSLPALINLKLLGDCNKIISLEDIPISDFLQRAPGLRSLTIHNLSASGYDLRILEFTPSLVSLKLSVEIYDSYGPLINALTYVEGEPVVYAPRLESLDLHIIRDPDQMYDQDLEFDAHAFAAMVQSRQIAGVSTPPVPFMNVCLRIHSSVTDSDMLLDFDPITSAQDTGEIEVSVHYTTNANSGNERPMYRDIN